MKKIPFDYTLKDDVESGDIILETSNGLRAYFIDIDEDPNEEYPLIVGIDMPGRGTINFRYNEQGIRKDSGKKRGLDLVMYEKEEEDFADDIVGKYNKWFSDHEQYDEYNTVVKLNRSEFLSLVEKIRKDGYNQAKKYYEPMLSC